MTRLVAITGGSASGKSTLAEALVRALPAGAATLVREDWYYHDVAHWPGFDPATFDFDDVAARDHGLLADHLAALKAGRGVSAPNYSLITHAREPGGTAVEPAPLIVVEGAHLLCTEALVQLFDLKVFVDTPADIRFIRRLLRDQAERDRTAQSVIQQYLRTVRPGHERFTEPSRTRADFVVADQTAAVRLDDPGAIDRLIAPVLAHPMVAALATPSAEI